MVKMTEDKIKKLLYEACCSIYIGGRIVGTGWVASDCCIVSAGHLFTEIVPGEKITAHFSNNRTYFLEVRAKEYTHDPLTDYAILRPLLGKIDAPVLESSDRMVLSGKFYTCGNGRTLTTLSSAEGEILGYAQSSKSYGKALLKATSPQSGEPGYSGCPIYSANANAVIAIQSEATSCGSGPERDTFLAYPLKYFWTELNNSMKDGSIEVKKDPLGLAYIVSETEFDRANVYVRGGDQMCAEGMPGAALRYYKIAKKIFEAEVGFSSKYVVNIQRRIEETEKRRGG